MIRIQGLSFLALVFRFARGRAETDRCASMRLELSVVALFSLILSTNAQEIEPLGSDGGFSISAQRLDQVRSLPSDTSLFTYQVRDQLVDNFDRRSLEFYVVRGYLANLDGEEMREKFGRSTKRRVERSITRTVAKAFERTEFVTRLREEPWKERIFDLVKDAFTEETPTIGTPLADEDPKVDYDVEKPVIQKPAWKDRVSFFFRPFSMHPNVGMGVKVDGIRAEIKAYHDQIKLSAFKPITDTWNVYISARMKDFNPEEAQMSVGFQHTIRCVPGAAPGILQYGVSIRNREVFDQFGREQFREFRPYAFMAFVFDY